MKHTKLPWEYFYSGSGGHDIVSANEDLEYDIATCQSGWALSKNEHFEQAEANAAFIVKAVNNHENLINTLQAIETELSSGEINLKLINEIIIMSREAIKQAEES